MERGLSKQQKAVLIRAQTAGGICRSSMAFAALVDVGRTLPEFNEDSILVSVGSTLQSLVELGLIEKRRPGEYHLTEHGFRIAESLGESFPMV